ncbi:uncharacterized protein [Procambarus clarkii]|uniref:uncharacterized protein n=1 Tax=Procambarus clarkii TaxID=6728 RepID=UPI00374240BB
MAGVIRVVLATVIVASTVHSQDWSDGCIVSRVPDQRVRDQTLDALPEFLPNNTGQSPILASWKLWPGSGSESEAMTASWGLGTLRVSYRKSKNSSDSVNVTESQSPAGFSMENVVIMKNCTQGQSIWMMTNNNKVRKFELDDSATFTIVMTEEVPLHVTFHNSSFTLCYKGHHREPCNNARKGLAPYVAMRLRFTLADTGYQVFTNGQVIRNETWNNTLSKTLTVTLSVGGTMKPTYLIRHHPSLIRRPVPQDPPVVSAAVVTLSVIVAVQAIILLCLLWRYTDVCAYLTCKRSGVGSLRIEGNKVYPEHPQPPTTSTTSKVEPLPLPPPRPANTLADPLHKIAEESHGDCEVDYVTPQAVKPLEVEILKQQNVILGQISHQTSPWSTPASRKNSDQAAPWSTQTHSHNPASRKNSGASHHTISRQQSLDTTHNYNSNFNNEDDEPNYMNVRLEDGVVRLHREPSDIYDTVDATYDQVHDTKPRHSSDIYDTVDNYDYYHSGDMKY